jgi:cell division protein FtsQ
VRVAGRRWDLHLDNGVVIKLPESDIQEALVLLHRYEQSQGLLNRDIAAVDLRLHDRTTIRLTADAAERRASAVEARAKALKKAGGQT